MCRVGSAHSEVDVVRDDAAAYQAAVRALYDRVSPVWQDCCSDTLQAGLVDLPASAGDPPVANDLWLATRAGVQDGERVLDLGCGVGGPAAHIARAYPGLQVDAMTLSPVQAALARARADALGVAARVSVHVGDYQAPPFEDATFDRAWFFESSGYAWDPDALFREVLRVLRPGGRVYIKDLFAREGPYTDDEAADIAGVCRLWAMKQVPTLADWARRLSAAGFVDVRHQPLPEVSSAFYWGSMFDDDFELNALGREFFTDFPKGGLVFYGEVTAVRPA